MKNGNTGFKLNQPRPTQYINYSPTQNRNDFYTKEQHHT